jgi:hypothetical protein
MTKAQADESILSTLVSKKIHTKLKAHAATEDTSLRIFIEAGMIMALSKDALEVIKIVRNFKDK